MKYTQEQQERARKLYLAAMNPKEIAKEVGVNCSRTIYNWIKKFEWDNELNQFGSEVILQKRFELLTNREKKTKLELEEIDRLVRNIVIMRKSNCELEERKLAIQEREAELAYVKKYGYEKEDNHGSGGSSGSNKKKRKRKVKNDISDLTEESFQKWIGSLYKYQKTQFEARNQKERWTLKSRQIGFTYEAAGEALFKAVFEGRNQTFLSASRAQAEVFRSYIVHIASQYLDLELTGNPIKLSNGAELRFLGTNKNTAQSYSSDVYIDEAFWIGKFDQLYEVASAMATLKEFKITVFSTPSTKQHKAYGFWTGGNWKGQDSTRIDIEFPTKERLRKTPQLCPDKRWRFVVDINDAIKGGNDRIDLEDLKGRYSPDAFKYLFLCEFMDEADSVFKLNDIAKCPVSLSEFKDFDPDDSRPFGDKPVWIGYDPSRFNDNARCVVVAPPDGHNVMADLKKFKDKFRVIDGYEWKGFNWQWQADQIEGLTKKYNVTHIGIDCSGIGSGVSEMVVSFFPGAMLINYTQQSKNELVLKMLDLVNNDRICWRNDFKTIGVSFMAIKRKTTGHGSMTFIAERTDETGHADDFFAIAHAVYKEPLNASRKSASSVRVYK